jgi:hypothetical protein
MKKLLLTSLITAASFGVSASSVITFDDSSFGGTGVVFDLIQFDSDMANVTQTDTDLSGDAFGLETFSEFGETDAVVFSLGDDNAIINPAYEVFFNYNFAGTANFNGLFIDVQFDTSMDTGLYIDTNVDGNFDLGFATQVAEFDINPGGFCAVFVAANSGVCDIELNVNFFDDYFFNTNGEDLFETAGVKTSELIVTVQDIDGFEVNLDNPGDTQVFTITHDGNMSFDVPEPTSIAILGLGLLGFAGARRRKA